MRIGFDLDKVFIDFPPFVPSSIIDALYKKHHTNTLTYRIPNKQEQLFRAFTHLPLFRPPIKENIRFLKNISKKNYSLYLISSRFDFLKNQTNHIIKQYNFDTYFNDMYFNYHNRQPHIFKTEIIKKLALDKYVDDDFELLSYLETHIKKPKLYWLNEHKKKDFSKQIVGITKLSHMFK